MGGIEIHPVTPDRWPDLVDLFERPGPRGAWSKTGACYCMFWRLEPAAYEEGFRRRSLESSTGGQNKSRMARVVTGDGVPGLVAYRDDRSIGWVSVSPRSDLVRLNSSRDLLADDGSADDEQTWSIACLYVYRSEWRTGVGATLIAAAVDRAAENGASVIEAYPVKAGNVDPYTGYDTMFANAGFRQIKPGRGLGRSLWRRDLRWHSNRLR